MCVVGGVVELKREKKMTRVLVETKFFPDFLCVLLCRVTKEHLQKCAFKSTSADAKFNLLGKPGVVLLCIIRAAKHSQPKVMNLDQHF